MRRIPAMELNYNLSEEEVFDLLENKKIIVLATSSDNIVTARSMSYILMNKKIYFQTSTSFLKYKQIVNNPNVALCVDNIQVEGIAKILKHPFEEKEFAELYKKVHKGSFENYSHMNVAIVIEVEPVFITLWKYENNKPFRDFLDRKQRKAYRELYDTTI
jgi:general stress protein 26